MKTVLQNLKSNRLIIVVYLLLFLLLGFASIEGINRQKRTNRSYDYIIDTTIHKIRLLRQARIDAEQVQARAIDEIFQVIPGRDDKNLKLGKALASNDSILREIEMQIENETERRLFDKMKLAWQTHKQSLGSFSKLNGDENSALSYYRKIEKNNWDNFYTTFNQYANFLYDTIKLKDKKIDDYVFISQSITNLLIAIVAVILIILGVLVVKSVKKISRHNLIFLEKDKVLSESRHLYKELFDKSPLPKWVCDRRTLQYYEVNDAALKHYGYSREEFLKLTVFDIRLGEDHEKINDYVKSDRDAASNNGLSRHIKKSGEIIWVEIVLNDIIYKDKEAILAVANDVTEKLKADQIIKDSEELYRSLFDNSPVFISVTEIPTLKHLEVNEIALASYGYSREEFLSMTAFDLFPQKDRDELKQRVQDSSSGNYFYHGYDRHVKKNGEVMDVEVRVHIINYKEKKAGLVIGIDRTEKIKAEQELRNSEEQYRSLFDKNPLPTFVVDKETLQFLQVNNAAVDLYRYSCEEFLELSVFDLRTKQDHEYLRGVVDKKINHELANYHVTHIKKNGEKLIVEVALETINYKGKEAFLAIVKDITKTLQLEKQLSTEKLNKQIEITKATVQGQEKERNELGKELHDNVNQILATAKLYLESSTANKDKQKEFVEKGKELINSGIQEIRRISKSLVPPSLGNLSLEEALKELIVPIRLANKHVDIRIRGLDEKNLCNDLIISIYRIVQEQLNNIVKYAEASHIVINLLQQDFILELNILDNGRGFDVSKKRHGIGITNMINRASLFNGNVVIDSSPGRGCCVTVYFTLPGDEEKIFKEITAMNAELN